MRDSKELSKEKREELFDVIKEKCDYEILAVQPQEIDFALTDPGMDLNKLTAEKMAELINEVEAYKVIVDSPSHNVHAFEAQLKEHLKVSPELNVKHKADRDHTIVGAASIMAKVTRDRKIKELEEKYDVEIGSGYPSDKITQDFIAEHWDDYDIFRKSWHTWKEAAGEAEQKGLEDY